MGVHSDCPESSKVSPSAWSATYQPCGCGCHRRDGCECCRGKALTPVPISKDDVVFVEVDHQTVRCGGVIASGGETLEVVDLANVPPRSKRLHFLTSEARPCGRPPVCAPSDCQENGDQQP
ncbi:hypothetical protein GCM10018779_27750 [Streptomyces griseocarneus]|nr:hypothetical protein GCM10018779_27750 [Streptomyces griseocarneus]